MKCGKIILTVMLILLLSGISIAQIPQDGLVSYWDFTNDATDSVSNNDGTLYGDASIVDAPSRGYCLTLDGNGDYVDCGDIEEIDLAPNQDITWTCWLNFSPSNSFEMILDKRQLVSGDWLGLGVWKTDDNDVVAKLYLGGSWSNGLSVHGSTIGDGNWHHLAVVCNRDGVMAMYIDGQFDVSTDISAFASLDVSNNAEFTIGNASDDASNYGCFKGKIDEVAVYSKALSAQEIQDIYDDGLVSYWSFDNDANDSVGNNDGILYGDASVVNDPLRGGCLSLDGDGDYVACGDINEIDLEPNRDITWMCWLKFLPGNNTEMVLDKRQYDNGWGGLGIWKGDNNTFAAKLYPGGSWSSGVSVVVNSTVEDSQWHHLAVSCDRDGLMAIYMDGQFNDSVDISAFASVDVSNDAEFTIGNASDDESNYGYFNGKVDEVAIYSKALSAQEIQDIYEAGLVEPESNIYHVDCATGDNDSNGFCRDTAFETIQYAIDEANDFDTILVWPGVYNEAATNGINFKGKAVTVKSAADAAVLEVPDGYAVSFVQGEGSQSVLSNFVIKNSQVAVFALYASPTITNLTIVDNENGILADNAEPDISNCIFWNNTNGDLFGTPDQLEARYSYMSDGVEDGLVALWKFDEGSGLTAHDSVNGHDASIHNATWVQHESGQALKFNGSTSYVDIPYSSELDIDAQSGIAVSVWIKLDAFPQNVYYQLPIFGLYAYNGVKNHLAINHVDETNKYIMWDQYPPVSVFASITPELSKWYHVVAVQDASSRALYINGVLNVSDNSPEIYAGSQPNTIRIGAGASQWSDYFFNGIIDEVAIYNKALSSDKISDIYGNGSAGYTASPLFADANNGDYHLLSERGRYRATTDEWILDDVTSPCVDGGDPAVVVVNERMPNGGRMNMGAYGNTSSASMSEWPLRSDYDYNGIVNFEDFAILANDWLETLNFEPNPEIDNDPPTPNPSQWLVEPYHSSGYHAMSAVQAVDAQNGPVWYKFYVVGGYGVDSGWQLSNEYRYYNMGTVAAYRVITCDSIAGSNPPEPNTANSTEPSEARVASE